MHYRQQPKYQSYRHSHKNNETTLYYDPVTGCYYYQEIIPTTTINDNSSYYTQNRPSVYVYTKYTNGSRKEDKNDRPGVIITEIDDDGEPIDKT